MHLKHSELLKSTYTTYNDTRDTQNIHLGVGTGTVGTERANNYDRHGMSYQQFWR